MSDDQFVSRSTASLRRLPAIPLDEHEPLCSLPPGIAASFLVLMDRAMERNDLETAARVERLLPSSIGADPPIVDRLATLRILEGDLTTADALLGACPKSTPRLDLLRAVLAVRQGDAIAAAALASSGVAGSSLGLRIVAALIAATVRHEHRFRIAADPTATVCAACRRASDDRFDGPRRLQRTLRNLLRLLGEAYSSDSLASAMASGLRGVAEDLGFDGPERRSGLEVTPGDADRIRLRVA